MQSTWIIRTSVVRMYSINVNILLRTQHFEYYKVLKQTFIFNALNSFSENIRALFV